MGRGPYLWIEGGGPGFPEGDARSFEASPGPRGVEPRWAYPWAEVPPSPVGMASRVPSCAPGSVCKVLLCVSLTFPLIQNKSGGCFLGVWEFPGLRSLFFYHSAPKQVCWHLFPEISQIQEILIYLF